MDEEALEKQRLAGKVARQALEHGLRLIKEGQSLLEVAEKTEQVILDKGTLPAFPANISIDSVAAHFTPRHDDGELVFTKGSLVKLDVGVHVDGYLADNASTVEVGTRNWTDLIRAADEAVATAVEVIRPGVPMSMVGAAIERTIRSYGFKPIENLTGHSLRRYTLHADKSVPNVGNLRGEKSKHVVEAGDSYAIEPFSTTGAGRVVGKKTSNIYRIVDYKESGIEGADGLLRKIEADFRTLPFSERWCYKLDERAPYHLQKLMRKGIVMGYPILAEAANGMVAQSEDTVVVTEDGCEVTTVL
ncbi:MAG: type II methionyl aminopeptidase [Thermoplasmata archaeon]